ncbi:MAG: hypothetical protein WC308_04525 [archaeon]|jgi:hypothetical protein
MKNKRSLPRPRFLGRDSLNESNYFNLTERARADKLAERAKLLPTQKSERILKKVESRTRLTHAVISAARKCSQGRTATQAVKNLLRFVSKINFVDAGKEVRKKFYNKQSADDIIFTGRIPSKHSGGRPVMGCHQAAITFAALLRAATPRVGKISNVKLVETISLHGKDATGSPSGAKHFIVSFKINGEPFIADPFDNGSAFLSTNFFNLKNTAIVGEGVIKEQIKKLKDSNRWEEGFDQTDFKILSYIELLKEMRKNRK